MLICQLRGHGYAANGTRVLPVTSLYRPVRGKGEDNVGQSNGPFGTNFRCPQNGLGMIMFMELFRSAKKKRKDRERADWYMRQYGKDTLHYLEQRAADERLSSRTRRHWARMARLVQERM